MLVVGLRAAFRYGRLRGYGIQAWGAIMTMTHADDLRLIRDVVSARPQAWDIFVGRIADSVWTVCLVLEGDEAGARLGHLRKPGTRHRDGLLVPVGSRSVDEIVEFVGSGGMKPVTPPQGPEVLPRSGADQGSSA